MFEDHLYWLDQIHTSHRLLVGDKAFYLGLLAQRRCPVIPGFVISSAIFQSFLEQIEWAEPMFVDLPYSSLHVDVDSPRQLQAVAQHIRQTLEVSSLSEDWLTQIEQAVQPWETPALILRPSIALPSGLDPTVSLGATGFLEARVCKVEKADIAQSLKQVWTELFRAKSLLYWQRLRIQPQQVNLAVLVQPIANAIASGDVQIHETYLEVRAIWGLGKALTNGEVTPDFCQVDLQTGIHTYRSASKRYAYQLIPSDRTSSITQPANCYQAIPVEPSQQTQPALSQTQLQELIRLTQQTATDLGARVGLEWTLIDQGNSPTLYVTQIIPHLKMGRWNGESQKTKAIATVPSSSASFSSTHLSDAHLSDAHSSDAHLSGSDSSSHFAHSPLLTGLAAAPGTITAPAWVSHHPIPPHLDMPTGVILVAPNITPDWLPWMKQAVAIITEQGGMTSHGAVLAREIGIPAITGAINATEMINTGDNLLIDGDRGEIFRVTEGNEQTTESGGQKDETANSFRSVESPSVNVSHPSSVLTATQLFVTFSQPNVIDKVANLPVNGVGLLRSELLLLEILEQRHPDLWIQQGQQVELVDRMTQQILQFAQAFTPRPVFYRSTDLRSHEFSHLQGSNRAIEPNPMLGLRGTWHYQTDPALFEIELAALRRVQQQGYTNVHLLLPFVRTVEEFRFCQQRIEQAGLTQNPLFRLWIMAEVPSVLLLLPDYIQAGVQGIAIGSNDLTQLLLGVDRDQPQLATAFNPLHPAVMRAIQHLIQTAQQAQIPCSICGQAAGQYPEMIEALVRWGITAISVHPNEVVLTQQTIARTEQRLLLDMARQQLLPRQQILPPI